jgi:hypothetical protein
VGYVAFTVINFWRSLWHGLHQGFKSGAAETKATEDVSFRFITVLKGAMGIFFLSCLMAPRKIYVDLPVIVAFL